MTTSKDAPTWVDILHNMPAAQQRLIGDAVATSALEGWSPTADQIKKLGDYVAGRITKAEHFAWVVEQARIEEARIRQAALEGAGKGNEPRHRPTQDEDN